MAGYLSLPKEKDALVDAVDDMAAAGEAERNIKSIEWFINHAYVQGARKITIYDWASGTVGISYEGDSGELNFKYEALLFEYQTQLGRLMRMNLAPVALSDGFGLDAVRGAGMGHAMLSYMTARMGTSLASLNAQYWQTVLLYGTAGVYHYRGRGRNIGERTCAEIVPPWELTSIPGAVESRSELRGYMRTRWVPLPWVESLGLIRKRNTHDLKIEYRNFGDHPESRRNSVLSAKAGSFPRSFDARPSGPEWDLTNKSRSLANDGREREKIVGKETKRREQPWVKLQEVFLEEVPGILCRYVVKIGDYIALDDDYHEMEVREESPLSIGHYIPTDSFYGRSYIGYLLSLNYENEKMLANQFQNVSEIDLYGMLCLPTTAGINKRQAEKREKRKYLWYDPDPTAERHQPFNIPPANAGDLPGKTAQLGISLQDKLSGQSEILQGGAPGRVDSQVGLDYLFEAGNISLTPPASSAAEAFIQIYRSMLVAGAREMEGEEAAGFKLPFIDDRMIGLVINVQTGDVDVRANVLPEPREIKIDIAERAPKSKAQTKQEALQNLQAGIISMAEFKILNQKEAYGSPVLSNGDFEAYRKSVLTKIVLFNDGETPGRIIWSPESDRWDIALMVLSEFMAGVEFAVASPPVQDAFIQLKSLYEGKLADMAELQMGIEQMGPGGGQGQLPGGQRQLSVA